MTTYILPFLALLAGTIIGYLLARLQGKEVRRKEIEENYIPKSWYQQEKSMTAEKEAKLQDASINLARAQEQVRFLEDRIQNHQKELEELKENFRLEFKNLANDLLEEKSKRFLEINEKKVGDLLSPLKEKINEFQKKVEENHKEDTRDRSVLRKELEQMAKFNQKISDDANRLTNALKGDKKMQGNWGELQLEMVLERAGLEKNLHYEKESSNRAPEGHILRPDYIIHLPEDKSIVIDSKVSLVSYEMFHNAEDELEKVLHMKRHLDNLREHIKTLGAKNYHQLHQINSPDYVIMFVPIEPALTAALREEPALFDKALEKNIVLVSVSTLLATLRTVAFIWKQENQRKHVMEIARESGALYDKFVGFIEDLEKVGSRLESVQKEYDSAMNKLVKSTKKGDTIIGRIERIKALGADTSKQLPGKYLEE